MAITTLQGGLHHRTGTREPGLTGGVSRADQAAEVRQQPTAPAQLSGGAPWSFVGHGGLAIAFAITAVLLAIAPEKASCVRNSLLCRVMQAAHHRSEKASLRLFLDCRLQRQRLGGASRQSRRLRRRAPSCRLCPALLSLYAP